MEWILNEDGLEHIEHFFRTTLVEQQVFFFHQVIQHLVVIVTPFQFTITELILGIFPEFSSDLGDGLYHDLAATGALGLGLEIRELSENRIGVAETDLASFFGG